MQLKEKAEKDLLQHNAEMKEHIRVIDQDQKLRSFMGTKCREREEDPQLVEWRQRKGASSETTNNDTHPEQKMSQPFFGKQITIGIFHAHDRELVGFMGLDITSDPHAKPPVNSLKCIVSTNTHLRRRQKKPLEAHIIEMHERSSDFDVLFL